MDIFLRNKFKSEDLEYLNELLKSNISIRQCLEIIKTSQNEKMIEKIVNDLDKGTLVETTLLKYMPKNICDYLEPLMKKLSFQKSLELALEFIKKTKENVDSLRKELTYPLVLLFVTLTALFLFDAYGLDSIINMMRSFINDIGVIKIFRVILRIFIYTFYVSMLIALSLALFFIKPKRITLLYVIICKYIKNNFVQTYFTEEFASLFIITSKCGYRTKEALSILKSLKNKPIISFMAFHIDDELLNGFSFKEATSLKYFDSVFCKFINIAGHTKNFNSVLNNYVELSRAKIKTKMNKLTKTISLLSYITIGAVVIFVYQVLFLPMQAISNF